MKFKKLNTDWNADPNDPQVDLEVDNGNLKVEFFLNTFMFHYKHNADKGELIFKACLKYSFNSCNDEGYFLGQYRYKNKLLPWGEFYEIETNWDQDFHPEHEVVNDGLDKTGLRHFIFFFRDNILECVAKDFEIKFVSLNGSQQEL